MKNLAQAHARRRAAHDGAVCVSRLSSLDDRHSIHSRTVAALRRAGRPTAAPRPRAPSPAYVPVQHPAALAHVTVQSVRVAHAPTPASHQSQDLRSPTCDHHPRWMDLHTSRDRCATQAGAPHLTPGIHPAHAHLPALRHTCSGSSTICRPSLTIGPSGRGLHARMSHSTTHAVRSRHSHRRSRAQSSPVIASHSRPVAGLSYAQLAS